MCKWLLPFGVVLALAVCGTAQAGLSIPIQGADIGPAVFTPIGDGETFGALDLTLHPWSPIGPETPTSKGEIIPWAKANFGIDIPFEGDSQTLIKPIGFGASEAAKVGTVGGVSLRGGIVYILGGDACLFLKTAVVQF